MTKHASVGPYTIEVSDAHIYLAENLPPTYDYVPWNAIGRVIDEARLERVHLIDVGANVGDSLAHFRRYSAAPVTCIEASPYFFQILERNATQFGNVVLHRRLLVPETLIGKVAFSAGGQTGASAVIDAATASAAWDGDTITFGQLLTDPSAQYIVKSDTDGFDVRIVNDLLATSQRLQMKVPLIFFEGPSAEQMIRGDVDDWLRLFRDLQASDYDLLVFSNGGMPYVYAGKSYEVVRSALHALVTGYSVGHCLCHYFDFMAIHSTAVSARARLSGAWSREWFDRG